MKREGKCVHYNGTINECCEAGVNYRELAGPADGWLFRLPCHGPEYRPTIGRPGPKEEIVTCGLRKVPTPEELAAEEA